MSSQPTRVLIAEDEALIRLDLKEMLEEEGYVVVAEVGDGQAAVEQARHLRPDLVIVDVQMPVLDGLGATRRIRAEVAADRQPHIVALTASALTDDRAACAAAGFDAFLSKPVRQADLDTALSVVRGRSTTG